MRIEANDINAVTQNEASSGDVAWIAEETGYAMRLATVIYRGERHGPAATPVNGVSFGNAVLTK